MIDTLLEDHEKELQDQQLGNASDAQLAQMAGVQPEQVENPTPLADFPPENQGAAVTPPPPAPQSAVDLLAQVKGGQISRPAVDKAFGPPPTPRPEASGSAQGLDWKQLADRLQMAHQNAGQSRFRQHIFSNVGDVYGRPYNVDTGLGKDEVEAAEEPLKLAEARQGMDLKQAQEERARAAAMPKAPAQKSPEELANLNSQIKLRDAQAAFLGQPLERQKTEDAAKGAKEKTDREHATDIESGPSFIADRDAAAKALGVDLSAVKTRKGLEELIGIEAAKRRAKPPKAAPTPEQKAISDESEKFMMGPYKVVPRAGTKPSKESLKRASEMATMWGGSLSGMEDLEGALRAYASHPNPDTARAVGSKVQTTAAAMNAAIGGGAMSEAELKNVSNALGADLSSTAGIQALLDSLTGDPTKASATLLQRLHSAREVAEKVAAGKLGGANYVVERPAGEAKAAPETKVVNGVTWTKEDGKWVTDG